MAITPPSDIVLDVARAADPVKVREAVERLARLSAAARAEAPAAAAGPSGAQAPTTAQRAGEPPSPATVFRPATTATPSRIDGKLDPYGQFEAFVLQSFIQSMLPTKADNVFGKGFAGDTWKSMLAEKLGAELARSGQMGIASRLAKDATGKLAARSTILPVVSAGDAPRPPAALQGILPYLQSAGDSDPAGGAAPSRPPSSLEQS